MKAWRKKTKFQSWDSKDNPVAVTAKMQHRLPPELIKTLRQRVCLQSLGGGDA